MMHIFSMKRHTKKGKIEDIPDPSLFYIPLSQHIGKPATPIVSVGDHVLKYQQIAEYSGAFSANIHAPASGIIREIKQHPLADGSLVETIVLENDFQNKEVEGRSVDVDSLTPEQILKSIQYAGIVGEGGAQFPTHVKYDLQGRKINTFIINGTECEPYLTTDYALMRERTAELFQAIAIINKLLNAEDIVISIEKQNKELVSVFQPFLDKAEYKNIRVVILPNQYPQGGELQLIKSVTGIELPKGNLPREKGVIVSNVGTVCAVYDAVVLQKPLVERVITVSGENANKPGNYRVKIGTPLEHILKQQKIVDVSISEFTLGGPMMGKQIQNPSAPILKGSSAVLFLKKKSVKRNNCISCGYCVDVCPMHLMPLKFAELYQKENYNKLNSYSISACIECAACDYICPSDVPLMESIKKGKDELKKILNHAS